MATTRRISRRQFGQLGISAAALSLGATPTDAQSQGRGSAPAAIPRPDALRSEVLMDLILETSPAIGIGNRTVVNVGGGTFEGPKLKGTVIGPGADWPLRVSDTLRVLDVRTLLVTDDNAKIYTTYRGLIHTPPGGELLADDADLRDGCAQVRVVEQHRRCRRELFRTSAGRVPNLSNPVTRNRRRRARRWDRI
jgi:hypothetical protein